jgi:hypothetical protein
MAPKRRTNPWVLLALFLVVSVVFTLLAVQTYTKFDGLSKHGKGTTAVVVKYTPRVTHSRSGDTLHHDHVITFDGHTATLELNEQRQPGYVINVVYMADRPSVVAEGIPGMSVKDLMGSGQFYSMMIMVLLFNGIFVALLIFNNPLSMKVRIAMQAPVMDDPAAGQPDALRKVLYSGKFTATIKIPAGIKVPQAGAVSGRSNTAVEAGRISLDEVYRSYISNPSNPGEVIQARFGVAPDASLKDMITAAGALDREAYTAGQDYLKSIKTREELIAGLKAKCPGFSDVVYEEALNSKI